MWVLGRVGIALSLPSLDFILRPRNSGRRQKVFADFPSIFNNCLSRRLDDQFGDRRFPVIKKNEFRLSTNMKLSRKLEEAEQQLEKLGNQQFDHLDFEWEDIKFEAATGTEKDGSPSIHLKARLGRLHFTVEDKNNRAMALERLFSTNRTIDGTYEIGRKGDISFRNITRTNAPVAGTTLMSAVTVILLEAENHLRALKAHLKPNS